MELTALAILLICSIIGFIAIFFTNVGTLIILIGAVSYALMTGLEIISLKMLIILGVLYLLGEALDYLFIIIGAKKFGASNWAVVGAIAGGILGAFIGFAFFGIGAIAGTFIGIFLGAFLLEYFRNKDAKKSLKAGAGSVLGIIGSIVAKVIIAIIMFSILASRIISTKLM